MAGTAALPVHSFLITLEHYHTQADVFNVLDRALAPGSGVTLHEVNKLGERTYRISIHVAPADKFNGQRLVSDLLEKALTDTVMPVEISTEVPSVARETFKGIGEDVAALTTRAAKTVGDAIAGILGGAGLGRDATGIGTIVLVLGLGALAIGAVVLTRKRA